MTNQINTYYIPENPNIPKGHIYTLYLNNNTNLDLLPILNTKTITIPHKETSQPSAPEPNQITISKEDYIKLLELNEMASQLSTQRTTDIQNFITKESKTITELTRVNTERQELIKKLTKGKEVA